MHSDSQQSPVADPENGSPRRSKLSSYVLPVVLLACGVMLFMPSLKAQYYRLRGIPAPADHIPWRTDFDAALTEAKAAHKPVLIDFSAAWCPPCQVMKHEVWPDPAVGEAVRAGFIPLLLDADAPGAQAIYARYDVSTIPAVLIVDGDGKVLRSRSYMNASEMIGLLKAAAPGSQNG